MKFFNIYFCI